MVFSWEKSLGEPHTTASWERDITLAICGVWQISLCLLMLWHSEAKNHQQNLFFSSRLGPTFTPVGIKKIKRNTLNVVRLLFPDTWIIRSSRWALLPLPYISAKVIIQSGCIWMEMAVWLTTKMHVMCMYGNNYEATTWHVCVKARVCMNEIYVYRIHVWYSKNM